MNNRAIVIYDSDCGVCELSRKQLERLDWLGKIECRSLYDKDLKSIHPELTVGACQKELKFVDSKGRLSGGADAIVQICLRLPLVMPLGWLFWIPPFRFFARWLYPVVAANRYRISSSCGLQNK